MGGRFKQMYASRSATLRSISIDVDLSHNMIAPVFSYDPEFHHVVQFKYLASTVGTLDRALGLPSRCLPLSFLIVCRVAYCG